MHQFVNRARSLAVVGIGYTRKAVRWFGHTAPHAAQSMVEYAIIAAVVAVIAVAAVKVLGEHVGNAFSRAETSIDSAGTP
jgi:Flp pilus assembly pilin Flp